MNRITKLSTASKIVFKVFLTIFFIFPFYISAQSEPECNYCGKKIKGEYIEAENKTFHREHFLCAKCSKVISGPSIVKNDEFYHSKCYTLAEGLVCGHCKDIIEGEYIEESGKKYHRNCFEDNVVPKCMICEKPLMEEYSQDGFGNIYHSYHSDNLNSCDNCGRLISKSLTNNGKEYADGRHICNICYGDAIFNTAKFNRLFTKVIVRLKSFGLIFNDKNISIKAVDRTALRQAAGSRYTKNMRGFCQSEEYTKYKNGRLTKKAVKHTIFVLNGIPELNIEGVIAHELTHVWLVENTNNNHSDDLREGSCNFIAFLYLNSIKTPQAERIIENMEGNDDHVYGKGFVKVKTKFESRNLSVLMDYLKTKKNL